MVGVAIVSGSAYSAGLAGVPDLSVSARRGAQDVTVDRHTAIRRLPYPYRGALAIANDAEFLSQPFFETLMAFVNGRGETPWGRGLGLECTSSIFFYSAHTHSMSYFDGATTGAPRSPAADRLVDYLRSGWIDTIHAYGAFDRIGGFERAHAERSFEELDSLGVRLKVFTNHGDDKNIQNIGGDAPYHRGDVPDHDAHHTDLLARHGVRYVWTDNMADEFQPRPKGIRWRWRQRGGFPFLTTDDRTMRDGTAFRGFRRLRGTGANAPNLSSLQRQLDLIAWDALYGRHESIVLYQHLGVLHRVAGECVPATVDAVAARPEVFLAPWRRLAREADEGRLWVVGLARLLAYREILEHAELVAAKAGALELKLDRVPDDPAKELAGLTLYVDTARPVTLRCQGTDLPLVVNGPDDTGRYSVSVAPARLPGIWP